MRWFIGGFVAVGLMMGLSATSSACSFNCGGTYQKGNEFGLKAPAHSGYKAHSFFNLPKREHSYEYIKDKDGARAGKAYQRFEVRDGDCFPEADGSRSDCEEDRERFEFTSSPLQKPVGRQCYGYSLKLSDDFKSVYPANTDLGQVHQIGGPVGSAGGFKSVPPIVQIGIFKEMLIFGWHKLSGDIDNVRDRKDINYLVPISEMRGVWTDISFCLDYENNRMDAWVNGVKKMEILESPVNFIPDNTYFKYGIYRSFVREYRIGVSDDGIMPTQIVFYDEVRRGTSIEEVDANINPKLKPVD